MACCDTLAREACGGAHLDRRFLLVDHVARGTPAGEAHGGQGLARRSLPGQAGGECRVGLAGGLDYFGCRFLHTGRVCVDMDRGDRRARTRGRAEGMLHFRPAPLRRSLSLERKN